MDSKSKKQPTKTSQVKMHLLTKGMIDSWTAINLYGATRLSAIIFIFRRRGMNIVSVPKANLDRNNELCDFVDYVLIQNETQNETQTETKPE